MFALRILAAVAGGENIGWAFPMKKTALSPSREE